MKIGRAAIHQKDIHPSIVVIIEKGATGTDCFRQKSLSRMGIVVNPFDATGFGGYLLKGDTRARSSRASLGARVRREPENEKCYEDN